MQLPFRAGCNVKVIDDIDVIALDSEFLQQQLHPAGQIHSRINFYAMLYCWLMNYHQYAQSTFHTLA